VASHKRWKRAPLANTAYRVFFVNLETKMKTATRRIPTTNASIKSVEIGFIVKKN
jgi:hypothetical protein